MSAHCVRDYFDVSVSHKSEGHVHGAHGHETTLPGHGEKHDDTNGTSVVGAVFLYLYICSEKRFYRNLTL